ncbi:MAG: alpha/beta hydrolase [Planctomycetaceae bacterium]|jgi:pimeloyl-ACP methyl ester carboxylesterase|nr:alpha/beta hydrolase [Planctomycetaceae bacterium]
MQRFFLILIWSTLTFTFTLTFVAASKAGDTWFADTRSTTTGLEHLTVKKLDNDNGNQSAPVWRSASLDELLETQIPQKPLIIVIHGNWMTSAEAQKHGIAFDHLLEKFSEHQLLIWSWQSEKISCGIRLRKDALTKAQRADDQATHLVAFLQKLKPNSKVALIGFSFGTKLVCNTLQTLADTKESGNELLIRSVLLAGAADCGSLTPNGQYRQSLSVTEKMLIHVNPDDKTLCFYPLLVRIGGPQAIGKKGASLNGLSEESRQKIKSVNVARQLGTEHAFTASFQSFVRCKKDFQQYALFE